MMRVVIYLSLLFLSLRCELLCVIELNRHGARSSKTFPNEPVNSFYGNQMHLTGNGFRQQQLLGEYVKKKYIATKHFLKPTYDKTEFEVTTTPTERTVFSAAGFVTGIYPGNVVKINFNDPGFKIIANDTIPVVDNDVSVSELPLQVIDPNYDSIFHPLACRYKGKLLKDYFRSLGMKKIYPLTEHELWDTAKAILKAIDAKDASKQIKSGKGVDAILNELSSYLLVFLYHNGLKFDDLKASDDSISIMKKWIINKWYTTRIKDTKYLRLISSEIFDTISSKFEHAIAIHEGNTTQIDSTFKKFSVFLTHDTTLINMISNLLVPEKLGDYTHLALSDPKIYNFLFPPYASLMLFELHIDDNGKYYVQVKYNGSYIDHDLKGIPNDSIIQGKIQFNDFRSLMSKIIEQDYHLLDCTQKEKNLKSYEDIEALQVKKKAVKQNFLKEE